ncbi:FG-GAP repeat domain-containing protein [Streptomyces melanogenes]|uniref:VCBS repeat-containing protein n=1 Tax=Streptomyces melanogenes TaxID=67326 RepID=A0ABZ1XTE1_9ACTN|nr:VCBS repeat-containing protein [Streptomyces melanogenes]
MENYVAKTLAKDSGTSGTSRTSGSKRSRIATRLGAAVAAAALVGAGATAAAAVDPPKPFVAAAPASATPSFARSGAVSSAPSPEAPQFDLFAADRANTLYGYIRDGGGALSPRAKIDTGWDAIKWTTQVDHDADGYADGWWEWDKNGTMYYAADDSDTPWTVGGGWNTYNLVLAPGNLGGAAAGDLLARDTTGALYVYLGYGTGKLATRYKVGGGWNAYNLIAGNGDLTGDGKADIVARDASGTLWLYKGTGNYKAPFEGRTRIGGGWNTYNALFSMGDLDLDGITDLIARGNDGSLWRYSGTGIAAAPFAGRKNIGTSGWNTYRLFF